MLSYQKQNAKRPKPWLREIEYTKAVLRDGNLVMGHTEEDGEFIEHVDGIDMKVEVKKGFFEHWGIDYIRPDITSSQLVQITVAFIVDAENGEIIKVADVSAIRFL